MHKFTLEWSEGNHLRSKTVALTAAESLETIYRIGRDQQQCEIVINDDTGTVSRLHAEIFLKPEQQMFYLRNATGSRPDPNFVMVDSQKVLKQEVGLKAGSHIQLGKLKLIVKSLEISQPPASQSPASHPQGQQLLEHQEYGLQCINGHRVSYDHVRLFCPYCGTALQAVETVVIPRPDKSA